MKKALICGISGQDGSYLARFLLKRGYEVFGTSRDAEISPFLNLERLGIRRKIKVESMSLNDFRSVLKVLVKVQPDRFDPASFVPNRIQAVVRLLPVETRKPLKSALLLVTFAGGSVCTIGKSGSVTSKAPRFID